jgi:hypothetical protein
MASTRQTRRPPDALMVSGVGISVPTVGWSAGRPADRCVSSLCCASGRRCHARIKPERRRGRRAERQRISVRRRRLRPSTFSIYRAHDPTVHDQARDVVTFHGTPLLPLPFPVAADDSCSMQQRDPGRRPRLEAHRPSSAFGLAAPLARDFDATFGVIAMGE